MADPSGDGPDPTLHLPRILCLHGGGVTGEIFRLQSRSLIKYLKPYFRLVFADGPFFCDPGPGIIPVFKDCGPYRRWLRWLPEHQEMAEESVISEIEYQLQTAMEEDDKKGATGEWVAFMGFSQGAKLSASLLFEQQVQVEKVGMEKWLESEYWHRNWRFGILLAGRAPLTAFSEEGKGEEMVTADQISEGFIFGEGKAERLLKIPTIHVHGTEDPGLHLHKRLLNQYCDDNSTTLIEWDGTHRVPIKSADVSKIVEAVLDVARQTGVLKS